MILASWHESWAVGGLQSRDMHDLASCAGRDSRSLVLHARGRGSSLSAKRALALCTFQKKCDLDQTTRTTAAQAG